MKRVDYTGRIFGQLKVISREDRRIGNRDVAFLWCSCSCGSEKWIRYNNLVNGGTVSCGCFQKKELSKRSSKPKGQAALHSVFLYYKRNAKQRNIEWKLTKEEFVTMIGGACAYCGTSNSMLAKTAYGFSAYHNGIDRVDNKIGYLLDNCVPCCNICNRAKSNMPVEEFLDWIRKLKEM